MTGPTTEQLVFREIAVSHGVCQRWRHRRHSWRRTSEGGFDPDRYVVAPVDEAASRAFVIEHHYARSFPAAILNVGLFDRTTEGAPGHPGRHVGSLVLSVPVQAAVLTGVLPDLEPYRESAEVGRLVLLDECPSNSETFFMARALRIAAELGIVACIAFSDPVARRNALTGEIVLPGHVGIVYRAASAAYTGRTAPASRLLLPDGSILNNRSVQKVRAQERGAAGVERRLVALGAAPRPDGDDPAVWLRDALRAVRAHRFRHPGLHRYVLVTPRARGHRGARIAIATQPYPMPGPSSVTAGPPMSHPTRSQLSCLHRGAVPALDTDARSGRAKAAQCGPRRADLSTSPKQTDPPPAQA